MVISAQEVSRHSRALRRPQHAFTLRTRPWQIQPFMLAPVLPGETLKNLLLQSRVVTDPIKSPFVGWWTEYYFFYVKHRDMNQRDDFVQMVLDPGWDAAPVTDVSAIVNQYFYGGTINWTKHCLERVVEEFFRNEGEEWNDYLVDGLPLASVSGNGWWDSAILASEWAGVGDVPVDADDDGVITAGEVDAAMRQWEFMRANKLTEMSYEDFLKTYGVRPNRVEVHRPELVRFVREWSYPSNTINPENGTPSSAVSWAVAERADKDRYFTEPGFLFGVTVSRPKVYMSKQTGSAAGLLADAYSWLPAVMSDQPFTSMKLVPETKGPLPTVNEDYWVDVRDLFLYGDQFVNFALTETDAGLVALPTPSLEKRYVTSSDMDALFSTASPKNKVRQDGIVSLQVMGSQKDHT